MADAWTEDWIAGRYGRQIGDRPDPEETPHPALAARMGQYNTWRQMFDGRYIRQELDRKSQDPDTDNYRWPSRVNLFYSISILWASMLWGRGHSGREADDLFEIRLGNRVPGIAVRSMTESASLYRDALEYWWSWFMPALRPAAATQQWAGGCILKISWMPNHPDARYGCILEEIQPEHFWPIWDATAEGSLLAAKIQFNVPIPVAAEKYGLTPDQAKFVSHDGENVQVNEYWDSQYYEIYCGKGEKRRVARERNVAGAPAKPYAGKNPWVDPITGQGLLPIAYIPARRTSSFFGDPIVKELEGPVTEINKALSDIGDALNDATHNSGVVADNHAMSGTRLSQATTFPMPKGEILNLGRTPTGGQQGRYWNVQAGEIPTQASDYLESLERMLDNVGFLTKFARGGGNATSGFQQAIGMLPSLYSVDWMRSHWSAGLRHLNRVLGVIFHVKTQEGLDYKVPSTIAPHALHVRQRLIYREVVPRDRAAAIQEVTQLAASRVLPPHELLKRIPDIEGDLDGVVQDLIFWLMWLASWDAAVAGRPIKPGSTLGGQSDKEAPMKDVPMPLPEVDSPPQEKQPGGRASTPRGQGETPKWNTNEEGG